MDPITIIIGATVSFVVQGVKRYFGTTPMYSIGALLVLSLLSGAGLFYLKQYGLIETFLQIIVYAGATYGLLIKNLEDSGAFG